MGSAPVPGGLSTSLGRAAVADPETNTWGARVVAIEGTRAAGVDTMVWFADANALVSALAVKTGASAVAIDVPDRNKAAVTLAEQMGLKPAFETARMYTGADPVVDYAGLFGVTSLELG